MPAAVQFTPPVRPGKRGPREQERQSKNRNRVETLTRLKRSNVQCLFRPPLLISQKEHL